MAPLAACTARAGLFLTLEVLQEAATFTPERAALGHDPLEQEPYASAIVAALQDLLDHPPAAGAVEHTDAWLQCLWGALQQAERLMWKVGGLARGALVVTRPDIA